MRPYSFISKYLQASGRELSSFVSITEIRERKVTTCHTDLPWMRRSIQPVSTSLDIKEISGQDRDG